MPPRVLHLDLDAFFVEVCRQRNPELRGVECLVIGGSPHSRGVVQSASYGARKFGVRSGMPTAQAARLCPQATFFHGDFSHYRDASRAVRKILQGYSPTVVMASLDEGYLDFTGTDRLHPVSLLPVAEKLRQHITRETGLDASIGIGPNRMIAKLASDFAKPRGICEVRAGWEEGFVAGLPLKALPGIGPRTAARLEKLGLTEVFQVQGMTEEALAGLVGDYARELKWRSHGNGSASLNPHRGARSISRETTLGKDATSPATLEPLLVRFVSQVAGELRTEGLVARTVVLKLRHGDFKTITRRKTLETPTDLDQELLPPIQALFGPAFQEARRRRQGVRLIGVAATNLVPAAPTDLFEAPERVRLRDLSRAVDQVRERFGFDAMGVAGAMKPRRRPD